MRNKKLNKKGFTLVELLAVIVVLAIILVITVPMILNTMGSAKSDSFDASLNTVVNYYREQLSLASLGRAESSVVTSTVKFNKKGELCASGTSGETCETGTAGTTNIADDFGKLGMQEDQYDKAKCTVQWDANGKVTVHLEGATGGEFAGLKDDKSK